ncbi:MAG: hypothetical protein ACE3JQ_02000 [Paenisporosarcina sp.]
MNQKADLYKIYQEKTVIIFKYLIKIVANPRDAEDIIREALYKFILYIDSVDFEKAFSLLFRFIQYYDFCHKQQKIFKNFEFIDGSVLPTFIAFLHNSISA